MVTVGTKLKQTLSNLKSCQADFESFALETNNQQAKQFYAEAAQRTQQLVDDLNERVEQVERQEPQYQGF